MPQFLIAIHRPNGYDPSKEDEAMRREIDALNDEMVAAGVRIFVGGLKSPTLAKSIRLQPGRDPVVADGLHLRTNEHVGGLWVLEADAMDEALAWGRKAASACRAPVEVREFH